MHAHMLQQQSLEPDKQAACMALVNTYKKKERKRKNFVTVFFFKEGLKVT